MGGLCEGCCSCVRGLVWVVVMGEWWRENFKLIVGAGLSREKIGRVVGLFSDSLRGGVVDLFGVLAERGVPVVVFSAGLGDVSSGILRSNNILSLNVSVVSNFFRFNRGGGVVGLVDGLIHAGNKSSMIKSRGGGVCARGNVLLLGDTLGDAGVVRGLGCDVVLRVGFLNEGVRKNRGVFLEKFDMVVVGDGSMDCVVDLVRGLS